MGQLPLFFCANEAEVGPVPSADGPAVRFCAEHFIAPIVQQVIADYLADDC